MIDRTELELLRDRGYRFEDPFDVITLFEERVAAFAGAPCAVAVDSCTHAVELSLRHLGAKEVRVPRRTYPSIPMTVLKIGARLLWNDEMWAGRYRLAPVPVVDAAGDFRAGSYEPGTFLCFSFHQKKTLPIGRGGMILLDDAEAAEELRRASYDGRRRGVAWKDDPIRTLGYHYYMTPEDAARGLLLMDGPLTPRPFSWRDYPDISTLEVFAGHGS